MLQILEAGLIERWQSKWYPVGNKCTGLERTTSQTNISLAEAQGAFYILGIGLMLAAITLVIEKTYQWKKNRRTLKPQGEDMRMSYVGRMGRGTRLPPASEGRFPMDKYSPYPPSSGVRNGQAYMYHTYPHGDSNQESEETADESKTKPKKSRSCPLLFDCLKRNDDSSYSMRNGMANGALRMRSAYSETLSTVSDKDGLVLNGVSSNGVKHSQSDNTSYHENFTGFTFTNSNRNATRNRTGQSNKDAETGEESREIIHSIRL